MRQLATTLTAALTLAAALVPGPATQAKEIPWGEIREIEDEIREIDSRIRDKERLLAVLAEAIPLGKNPELDAARKEQAAAAAELEGIMEESGANELKAKLNAARDARDSKVDELLKDVPAYQRLGARRAAAEAELEPLEKKMPNVTEEEATKIARLRAEVDHVGGMKYGLRRAWWQRAETLPLYRVADQLYRSTGSQIGKLPGVKEAQSREKAASRKLQEARNAAAEVDPRCQAVVELIENLAAQRETLKGLRSELQNKVAGGAEWTHTITVEGGMKKGKRRDPNKAELWIPPGCKRVRGIIIGHPPVLGSKLPRDRWIRIAAVEQDLAVIHFRDLDALFTYTDPDTIRRFEKALDDFAEVSGHSELTVVPWLTIGHSTSGIFCRNVAYWKPDRVIGVIHVGSGNMHQHRPDPEKSLSGVPFIAINGELEEYGPEGGIQPAYGNQTQWIMIREQLLRRRQEDPNHLMSLVVNPGGGHSSWNNDLSRLAALFIRKAAQARIPDDVASATEPVTCNIVPVESGWLSDAFLTDPTHPPAPYADYTSDKGWAFWHFDGEMAGAVRDFHDGRFILPDLGRTTPVPDTWPPKKD